MEGWERYLTEEDRAIVAKGRWAQRMGFGSNPAVLVIDAQNYMAGERDGEQDAYPYSCGAIGWSAIDQIQRILAAARGAGATVVYTRFVLDPSGNDAGNFTRKVGAAVGDFVMYAGTHGAEIVDPLAPQPGELVVDKKKASAFFGTPVLPHLIDRGVDTCIVVGGSTSNCIRATVIESSSYNFRTIVPAEAVFDRIPISHHTSLFDMNRLFADVVGTDEVVAYLNSLRAGHAEAAE